MIAKCYYIAIFFFSLFAIAPSISNAQDSTLNYKVAFSLAAASSAVPFWAHANQNGAVPMNGNFALGKWGAYKTYHPHNPRVFQWSCGAELITNYSKYSNIFFSDLYVAGKVGQIEFLAGQKKDVTGLMDTTLTSGSLVVSANSRPIPRFQISIPEFYPLTFTNSLVAIKASYSDGRLGGSNVSYGSVNYVPNTYFHQKTFYFRIGNVKSRLLVFGGLSHQVIWGGENKISPLYRLSTAKAYWYSITGKTLDYRKVGSHLGTFELAVEWRSKNWSYFLYRQNIYETGHLFKVDNFTDGLSGIRLKRRKPLNQNWLKFSVNSLVFEVIGTKGQNNNPPLSGLSIFEKGNFFNSYIYGRGWSYKGNGIGTPLISNQNVTVENLPHTPSDFTNNNRIWAFHSGLAAVWLNTDIIFKGTFSRNFGTYVNTFNSEIQQLSIQISVEKNLKILKNGSFIASFYSDIGKLYPNSSSLHVGFRKQGFFL